jgi:hypothetical protein
LLQPEEEQVFLAMLLTGSLHTQQLSVSYNVTGGRGRITREGKRERGEERAYQWVCLLPKTFFI